MDSIDALRNDVARLREVNTRLLSEQKEYDGESKHEVRQVLKWKGKTVT